ncbi:MAG TPA: hypothetical protein VMW27_25320 [Thermoanaerobaculia bacterium]|nr:hypothetical protein [Thermoanaerobaculia bacterium]
MDIGMIATWHAGGGEIPDYQRGGYIRKTDQKLYLSSTLAA